MAGTANCYNKNMKKFFFFLLCAAAAGLFYSAVMFVYVKIQMRPLKPLVPASAAASHDMRRQVHLLHEVNSVQRAKAKDRDFEGFEMDLNRVNGQLMLAHDEKDFSRAVPLSAVFETVQKPAEKTYWMDLKTTLTPQDIDELKALAARYGVSPRRMLFETGPGETADLLNAAGFPILLQVVTGFGEDGNDPQTRAELNVQMEELLRRYRPFAIAASLGKYPALRAYFPLYNKAIYSATTVRPSLKKKFLKDAMFKDPTVLLFMQDEYTALPF